MRFYCYECYEDDPCILQSKRVGFVLPNQCPFRTEIQAMPTWCKEKKIAKNTEQQVQPDNAEKEIPFGYYPNNEFEE